MYESEQTLDTSTVAGHTSRNRSIMKNRIASIQRTPVSPSPGFSFLILDEFSKLFNKSALVAPFNQTEFETGENNYALDAFSVDIIESLMYPFIYGNGSAYRRRENHDS